MRLIHRTAFAAGVLLLALWTRGAYVWIEGEKPARASVTPHPWYDSVKRDQLSGGDWLSNFGRNAKVGEALYQLKAPAPGTYALFIRLNPAQAAYSVRIGAGDWQTLDVRQVDDITNIAADGKIDLRFVGWIKVGEFKFTAAPTPLAVRIDGKTDHHGAIDAIVLTDDINWRPHGLQRPGESAPEADASQLPKGQWIWAPERDAFAGEALLDLSYLNEKVAGEHGFIRVDEHGDFINDAGAIRFWAVGDTVYRKGPDALRENAKFLAKHGVNMVRWHGNLAPQGGQDLNTPDEQALDDLFKLVAAMKAEGIYITVSPYYAHSTKVDDQRRRSWGLPRDPQAGNTGSLLFFDPKLQNAYKNWVRVMLTRTNPYTGVALKDDPAVAIFQIQNEDSLLFWTINGLKGDDRELLRKAFGGWLKRKYGTLAAARKAWGDTEANGPQAPSNWNTGAIEISNAWAWFQPNLNRGGLGARMSDEVQFLTETMKHWNDEVAQFVRNELGAKQVINAGNWKTADPLRLNDLERYSYAGQQVIGVNRYTSALHKGKHEGWAIVKGDRFANRSVTLNPRDLPVGLKQVAGKAMIIPEGNWVPPNLYQSEAAPLVAAYMSLNGVDAFYWFNMGQPQWREPQSSNGYLDSIGKWVIETPEIMGNFPAAALMYRRGDIARGKPVVVEHRSLDDLWNRRPPVISEEGTFDPNRDAGDGSDRSLVQTQVDPLAFLVGPVQVIYDSDPRPRPRNQKTQVADLAAYINARKQVVTSETGQLQWNYAEGLVTINAPRAQGAVGFLKKADAIRLADVTVESHNAYGSVLVVAMDDKPLTTSEKVLVQVGTTARPSGWRQRDAGDGTFEILEHGHAPWLLEDIDATVTVANPRLSQAVVLDGNGYARQTLKLQPSKGAVQVKLPRDAKYVVLQ